MAASGSKAGLADTRAVRELIGRYYAAAASGDAAIACSLLDKSLADELASESERSSSQPGGCPAAMSKALVQEHEQLLREDPATMAVLGVRVNGDLGLAVLGFKAVPEGEVLVERVGGAWKMGALLDSRMP